MSLRHLTPPCMGLRTTAGQSHAPRGRMSMRDRASMISRLVAAAACAIATATAAVDPSPGVLAVASYRGADRTERLAAGAKKEGELMLYSSLTQEGQLGLAGDFKRRYGVTVKFWRGSQAHILQRVTAEARGGRFEFDVLETNSQRPPRASAVTRCR